MSFSGYLLLFFSMGLVTFVPRWLPLFYLSHRRMPQWLTDWLGLIPVAILSSLLAPILLIDSGSGNLNIFKPELLIALPTLIFAMKTKSLGGTVLVGMVLYWLLGVVS